MLVCLHALYSFTIQCTNVDFVVQICKYFTVNVEKMYGLHIYLNACSVFFFTLMYCNLLFLFMYRTFV